MGLRSSRLVGSIRRKYKDLNLEEEDDDNEDSASSSTKTDRNDASEEVAGPGIKKFESGFWADCMSI